MDATVQVAMFGIIATLISTAGVVLVAIINKHTPTPPALPAPPPNPEDVPDSEWAQIIFRKETAIRRREETIIQQKATIEDLEAENAELRAYRDHCERHHGS